MEENSFDFCSRTVPLPDESGGFSIADIAPTLLRYIEKKEGTPPKRLVSGSLVDKEIMFQTLYDIQKRPAHCGGSLEDIIENRLNTDLQSFNRIIVFIVDGMSFATFFKSGKMLFEKIHPEIINMFTTFPSSTPVATTTLLTGAFPIAHGVVADKFFNMDSDEEFDVKPSLSDIADESSDMEIGEYFEVKPDLSESAKLRLPRIIPITTHFILSSFWDQKDCSLGLISAGNSHSQSDKRRFLDFFFGDEFLFGGGYTKTRNNIEAFQEAQKFIRENKDKKFWLLFVRFTIDQLTHQHGSHDPIVITELKNIFNYILDINKDLRSSSNKNLLFLVSDHGHKPVPEGFVSFNSFKKYLGEKYEHFATNQTLLCLYHKGLHAMILKSHDLPRLARVRKKGSEFYCYDWDRQRWRQLRPGGIERFATKRIQDESYGVGYHIGDVVLHLENFYIGGQEPSEYSPQFMNFMSSHGGLSMREVYVPGFFWQT